MLLGRPMAATPNRSSDPLQAHLERCLVQVLVGGQHSGTGFFVALSPGSVSAVEALVLLA